MNAIVSNHKTLAAMERAGFIVRHGNPGEMERHWTGRQVPVIHCSEGPALKSWSAPFTFKGREYRLRYFDGCFYAFVVEIAKDTPGGFV